MNMMQISETNVVQILEPLGRISERIDAAYRRLEGGRREWIEGTLELAAALACARKQFVDNWEFSSWLRENGHSHIKAPERAALIHIAEYPELARTTFEETHGKSWCHTWYEHISPKVVLHKIKDDGPAPVVSVQPHHDNQVLASTKKQVGNLSSNHSLHGLPRANEINQTYVRNETTTLLGKLVRERGGKEIWSLILQAKDAGFLTQTGIVPAEPTIRLLFPDAPLSWTKNYLLTDTNHRAYIRDELMPAAIANKDAILAEPEKIEIILRDHFARQKTVAKKAVEDKKLVIARETTEHDDVVVFGKRYWPIVDKTQFDYDFEQLAAAFWFFNEMHCMAGANGTSPGACSHGIRFAIGRLQQYVTDQDMNSPVRANMRRLLNVVISLANALEENPDGECIRPPLPR